MTKATIIQRGLVCRCHVCGEGAVFSGYLTLAPACSVCGTRFDRGDTADGPAFFVMFLALIIFAPFFFLLPLTEWPILGLVFGFTILSAATLAFILWALRPFKAVLLNLQLANDAEEATRNDI